MELAPHLEQAADLSPLAAARVHRKLTIEKAAKRAGLTAEQVEWLEEGRVYRFPSADDALMALLVYATALEPGELFLELEVPQPEASTYLKAMDRRRWSFALVGVAAARFGSDVRLGLAGVAPIPWALNSPEALDQATPLPGTAYKVELARALIRRALAAVAPA